MCYAWGNFIKYLKLHKRNEWDLFSGDFLSDQSVELRTNDFCLFVCLFLRELAEEGLRPANKLDFIAQILAPGIKTITFYTKIIIINK